MGDESSPHGSRGDTVDLPPSPAQLPRRLLADPAFLRALKIRDFSVIFSMANGARVSFNRIAE